MLIIIKLCAVVLCIICMVDDANGIKYNLKKHAKKGMKNAANALKKATKPGISKAQAALEKKKKRAAEMAAKYG